MKNPNRRQGFTWIELVFVVALLSIVAWILLPEMGYTRGRRNAVARVQADQRSMATALASYYVDNNGYPLAMVQDYSTTIGRNSVRPGISHANIAPARIADMNAPLNANAERLAKSRVTFAHPGVAPGTPGGFSTLTTPIAYLTSYFRDPFSPGESLTFSYLPDNPGFLLTAFRPRPREANDPIVLSPLAQTMRRQFIDHVDTPFDGRNITLSKQWIRVGVAADGRALTYDPTNGVRSEGSVYRISD